MDEDHGWVREPSDGEEAEVLRQITHLIRMRQVGTFALTGRALEISRLSGSPAAYHECLEYLLALEDRPERVLNSCRRCLHHEFDNELDYDDWSSRGAANLEAVVTNLTYPHVRTLLAILAYKTSRDPVGFTVPPTAWLRLHHKDLTKAAEELKESHYLTRVMKQDKERTGDTLDAVLDRLRQAGRAGHIEWQRSAQEKPLDGQRSAQLKRDCRTGWESDRLLPSLFEHFGAYRLAREDQVRADPLKTSFTLSRELLLKDYHMPLGEEEGRRYGQSLVQRATQVFWDRLEGTLPENRFTHRMARALRLSRDPEVTSSTRGTLDYASLREGIDEAIAQMRTKRYSPSVVLLASHLSLGLRLDDESEATQRLNVPRAQGKSGHAGGEIGGVPVLVVMGPQGREDFCCVIDLERLGEWTQAILDDGDRPLRISLSSVPFTVAPTQPTEPAPGSSPRARDDIATVRLTLEEKFRLKIRDKRAVWWVVTPRREEVPLRR